jgi:hypothetical protein
LEKKIVAVVAAAVVVVVVVFKNPELSILAYSDAEKKLNFNTFGRTLWTGDGPIVRPITYR